MKRRTPLSAGGRLRKAEPERQKLSLAQLAALTAPVDSENSGSDSEPRRRQGMRRSKASRTLATSNNSSSSSSSSESENDNVDDLEHDSSANEDQREENAELLQPDWLPVHDSRASHFDQHVLSPAELKRLEIGNPPIQRLQALPRGHPAAKLVPELTVLRSRPELPTPRPKFTLADYDIKQSLRETWKKLARKLRRKQRRSREQERLHARFDHDGDSADLSDNEQLSGSSKRRRLADGSTQLAKLLSGEGGAEDSDDSEDESGNDTSSNSGPFVSSTQHALFTLLSGYRDVWFSQRTPRNAEEISSAYALHAVNHVLQKRQLIIQHNKILERQNQRLKGAASEHVQGADRVQRHPAKTSEQSQVSKKSASSVSSKAATSVGAEEAAENSDYLDEGQLDEDDLDEGDEGDLDEGDLDEGDLDEGDMDEGGEEKEFNTLSTDSEESSDEEVDVSDNDESDDDEDKFRDQGFTRPSVLILLPFRNSAFKVVNHILSLVPSEYGRQIQFRKRFEQEFGASEDEEDQDLLHKPEDYRDTFAGNLDDSFRMGLAFGKKSVRLFTDFYQSDIIVASPLGLRTIVGVEGDKKRDFGFLSSIEVCVIDQACVMTLQNWDHVLACREALYRTPTDPSGIDFARVRFSYLDAKMQAYAQTVLISSWTHLSLLQLFRRRMLNFAGQYLLRPVTEPGVLSLVARPVRQLFQRIDCKSLMELPDARFNYFTEQVLPRVKASTAGHCLIFVPSYFDFVRLRNWFKKKHLSFELLSEYTPKNQVSRSRSNFFHGRSRFIIVTERFHFYKRYHLRGIQNLIMYALPDNPRFYSEFVNMIPGGSGTDTLCLSLFSRFDQFQLERVVGEDRSGRLLSSDRSTHLFI